MIALICQNDWSALAYKLAEKFAAADFEVSLFLRNGQAAATTSLSGKVTEVKSQASAIKSAETIITLLNTPQEVEDVYLGSNGVLEHAAPASLLIDLSTSNPRLAKEIHALAAVHDHSFIEAPIEGSFDILETGSFKVYAAGEPDDLTRALPVLSILTEEVCLVGLPGNGSILKLASQIALANTMMGLVEQITFLLVAGIEKDQVLEILEASSLASAVASAFGKRIIDEEFYYGVELQQFFFDLTAALDVADEYGLALPGLETAHQLYDLLVLVGGSKKGIHALTLIYYDEDHCKKHGLNWELAQQAMDVYERANEGVYCDYDYDCDDDDDDECDDPNCRYHTHHRHGDDPPAISKFFSPN